MFKTDISEIKGQQLTNFEHTQNSSPDEAFQKKNRDQWRKVLGTFDLIKDKTSVTKTKPGKKYSTRNKKIKQKATSFQKNSLQKRSILSSSLTNTITEKKFSQVNLGESDIVWSSSNEESDCLGIEILNKRTISKFSSHLKMKGVNESEINWSSSNESENEENVSLNKKKNISRCKKYSKRKAYELEISWSSSNESENEECELDSFLKEIEKDLRRTKKINHKLATKKGGYLDSFRKAVSKSRADTGFLDYEQRAEIICGCHGVITEKKVSYGKYLANVRLEAGSNCFIFLGQNMQSSISGTAVVCFLDESRCYTVNNGNVYVQPNKVISI